MRILFPKLILLCLWCNGVFAQSSDNILSGAISLYETALTLPGESQITAAGLAHSELNRIVAEYPESDTAVLVLVGEVVGGIDVAGLTAFLEDPETNELPPLVEETTANVPTEELQTLVAPVQQDDDRIIENEPSSEANELALSLNRTATGQASSDIAVIDPEVRIRLVQENLNRLGCSSGTPDGVLGRRTRGAHSRYLEAKEITGGNYDLVTDDLLALLASDTGTVCETIPVRTSRSTARSRIIAGVRWTHRPGTTYPYCKPCGRDYQCRAENRSELCQMYPPSGW